MCRNLQKASAHLKQRIETPRLLRPARPTTCQRISNRELKRRNAQQMHYQLVIRPNISNRELKRRALSRRLRRQRSRISNRELKHPASRRSRVYTRWGASQTEN